METYLNSLSLTAAPKPPSFYLGLETTEARTALELPDFTRVKTPRNFIHALRPICEIIFDLMLNAIP